MSCCCGSRVAATITGASRRLALEVHLDRSGQGGLFAQIAARTFRAYVRMSATVVIAVVVRICLDCIGIILTEQEPTAVSFWFSHCAVEKEGSCVAMGISIFAASLFGCSAFAYFVRDWITDPSRNPRARHHSFAIVVEAATWVPISVVVGKTNALVEWFMDVSDDDLVQALVASAIAALITLFCTLLTHVAMKHCRSVAENAQPKTVGMVGFFKFVLLATLYCLGWAVGWSNWKLVLSMMDALEPGTSVHNMVVAGAVISVFLVVAVCFYLRFGPEPIIPDPELQQLCYGHGFSGSIRRSLISYAVYSCTVFVVLACSDSTYGFLHIIAEKIYSLEGKPDAAAAVHAKLLLLLALGFVACVVTALAALCSAAITRTTEVDALSSMRLSRSVSDARKLMLDRRTSAFSIDGPRQERETELSATTATARMSCEDSSDSATAGTVGGGGGDAAAGPRSDASSASAPPRSLERQRSESDCHYRELENFDIDGFATAIAGDQPEQSGATISRTVCASVLAYDVLGLVVCFQWGTFAFRCYGILFGHVAGLHSVLYVLSSLLYAATIVYGLTRFVWRFFPSAEELKTHKLRVDQGSWFLSADNVAAPFLEEEDDGAEDMAFFVRAPPSCPPGVSWPPLMAPAQVGAWQPVAISSVAADLSPHGAI